MALFQPHLETCPICGSTGNCHIHDYYGRSIVDFISGRQEKSSLCLPDVIIPYSTYSLFFVLRILAEYFAGLHTSEQLCERFDISDNQLRKWISLWRSHKRQWLGLLDDASTSDQAFLEEIVTSRSYSIFSMSFICQLSHSFLQSHKNPSLTRSTSARYHQTVFAPDISIF